MMNRQKPSAVYKETADRQTQGLASLLWLILGLVIAVAVAAAVYFSPLFDGYRTSQTPIGTEKPVEPIAQDEVVPAPTYEFYEVLPKQDFRSVPEGVSVQDTANADVRTLNADAVVVLSDSQDEKTDADTGDELAETDATDDKNTTTYMLQIRSYLDAKEADEKRAQVMLSGVDALVLKQTDKATGESVYQVVSTPMSSRQEASEALLKLRNNGIDALMVEQRHR